MTYSLEEMQDPEWRAGVQEVLEMQKTCTEAEVAARTTFAGYALDEYDPENPVVVLRRMVHVTTPHGRVMDFEQDATQADVDELREMGIIALMDDSSGSNCLVVVGFTPEAEALEEAGPA
jgi:hypothetical protein